MRFTLLCHNVFWFQGTPFQGDQPRAADPEVMRGLAMIYRGIQPDLVCLQEVQSAAAFEALSLETGMAGAHCPGNCFPQYGGAVLWREPGARLVQPRLTDTVRLERMRQIVEVGRPQQVLTVANVHLPSSRQTGVEASGRQRIAEIAELFRVGPPPVDLIAGDFNERFGGGVAPLLEANGFADAAVLMGRQEQTTNLKSGRGDRIWLRQSLVPRLVDYGVVGQDALRRAGTTDRHLSDHLPLWAVFEL